MREAMIRVCCVHGPDLLDLKVHRHDGVEHKVERVVTWLLDVDLDPRETVKAHEVAFVGPGSVGSRLSLSSKNAIAK